MGRVASVSLWVITDNPSLAPTLTYEALSVADVTVCSPEELVTACIPGFAAVFVDVDLSNAAKVLAVKRAFTTNSDGRPRVFACDTRSRAHVAQALALGATRILPRPVSDEGILHLLSGHEEHLQGKSPGPVGESEPLNAVVRTASASAFVLAGGFGAALKDAPLDGPAFRAAATVLSKSAHDLPLELWLTAVRDHHQGTYRHVLYVAGVTAHFARVLQIDDNLATKVTLAALVHDIGKARVPSLILDKPTELTPAERCIIERHPDKGYDFLARNSDLDPEILFAVRHHHEMLDGSGYPSHLTGSQIPPITRIVTIADIYCALVEPRGYRLGWKPGRAYDELRAMASAGKLDSQLVAAFRLVADIG